MTDPKRAQLDPYFKPLQRPGGSGALGAPGFSTVKPKLTNSGCPVGFGKAIRTNLGEWWILGAMKILNGHVVVEVEKFKAPDGEFHTRARAYPANDVAVSRNDGGKTVGKLVEVAGWKAGLDLGTYMGEVCRPLVYAGIDLWIGAPYSAGAHVYHGEPLPFSFWLRYQNSYYVVPNILIAPLQSIDGYYAVDASKVLGGMSTPTPIPDGWIGPGGLSEKTTLGPPGVPGGGRAGLAAMKRNAGRAFAGARQGGTLSAGPGEPCDAFNWCYDGYTCGPDGTCIPTSSAPSYDGTSPPLACAPGWVWSQAQKMCIRKTYPACKPGEHLVGGKCMKSAGLAFGFGPSRQLDALTRRAGQMFAAERNTKLGPAFAGDRHLPGEIMSPSPPANIDTYFKPLGRGGVRFPGAVSARQQPSQEQASSEPILPTAAGAPTELGAAPPAPCPPNQGRDSAGNCQPVTVLAQRCSSEGLPVDEASDFARSFAYWKAQGHAVEEPHWDASLGACTQVFFAALPAKPAYDSAWKAFKNSSGQWVYFMAPPTRRTWSPTVPIMAYVSPTGSKSDSLTWQQNGSDTPCPAGEVYSAAQKACVKQYVNPCKHGEHFIAGKCVKAGATGFGPPGVPGAGGSSTPALDAMKKRAGQLFASAHSTVTGAPDALGSVAYPVASNPLPPPACPKGFKARSGADIPGMQQYLKQTYNAWLTVCESITDPPSGIINGLAVSLIVTADGKVCSQQLAGTDFTKKAIYEATAAARVKYPTAQIVTTIRRARTAKTLTGQVTTRPAGVGAPPLAPSALQPMACPPGFKARGGSDIPGIQQYLKQFNTTFMVCDSTVDPPTGIINGLAVSMTVTANGQTTYFKISPTDFTKKAIYDAVGAAITKFPNQPPPAVVVTIRRARTPKTLTCKVASSRPAGVGMPLHKQAGRIFAQGGNSAGRREPGW